MEKDRLPTFEDFVMDDFIKNKKIGFNKKR